MAKTKQSDIVTEILAALKTQASVERAKFVAGYFKTGKGQYGEGDIFWGLTVPAVRKIAMTYWKGMTLTDIALLLANEVHEVRLVGLLMLVKLFEMAQDEKVRSAIYDFYLDHTKSINNWDLVDLSAPRIVGVFALSHPGAQACLKDLVTSKNIWERRISMIAMLAFVKAGEYKLPLQQATALLDDTHDLLHKAVGWVLREIGKQDSQVLETFLDKHAKTMPRTALRYAIEKFDDITRQHYLQLKHTT